MLRYSSKGTKAKASHGLHCNHDVFPFNIRLYEAIAGQCCKSMSNEHNCLSNIGFGYDFCTSVKYLICQVLDDPNMDIPI